MKKKKRQKIFLVIGAVTMLLLTGSSGMAAKNNRATQTSRVIGKKDGIVTLEVKTRYVMGDNDTRLDARKIAVELGKNKAVEAVGSYVKSELVIIDSKVAKEEIASISASLMKSKITEEKFTITPGGLTGIDLVIMVELDKKGFDERVEAMKGDKLKKAELKKLYEENRKMRREMEKISSLIKKREEDRKTREEKARIDKEIDGLVRKRRKIMDNLALYGEKAEKTFAEGAVFADYLAGLEAEKIAKIKKKEERDRQDEAKDRFERELARVFGDVLLDYQDSSREMKIAIIGKPIVKRAYYSTGSEIPYSWGYYGKGTVAYKKEGEKWYKITFRVRVAPRSMKAFRLRVKKAADEYQRMTGYTGCDYRLLIQEVTPYPEIDKNPLTVFDRKGYRFGQSCTPPKTFKSRAVREYVTERQRELKGKEADFFGGEVLDGALTPNSKIRLKGLKNDNWFIPRLSAHRKEIYVFTSGKKGYAPNDRDAPYERKRIIKGDLFATLPIEETRLKKLKKISVYAESAYGGYMTENNP